MKIYDYEDYKLYVNDWVMTQPKSGYGQFKKIADFIGINSVVISQIFKGDRQLSLEQACEVSRYIGLDDLEKDFFLLLVQIGRSGSHDLTKTLSRQLKEKKKTALNLKSRIKHSQFSNEDKAEFYSQWFYSAIRLSTDIDAINSIDDISSLLGLQRETVANILTFLKNAGLVVEKNNVLNVGPQVTHVGHDSPFVYKHHSNWRLKSLQCMENVSSEKELFYTGPMALSEEAADDIRSQAVQFIERATKTASKSNSATVACLNLDWFRVVKKY
ncbi:MAG: TIGR02147 family protein [Bdellovibrionales bacterium]|nr:TIGR02147 family protein [Bdellovibrionales bacterium]